MNREEVNLSIRRQKLGLLSGADQLAREKVIAVTGGLSFRADYFDYLRQYSPAIWEGELCVLIGSEDSMVNYAAVRMFSRQQGGVLEMVEGAEHYFHKPDELQRFRLWLRSSMLST